MMKEALKNRHKKLVIEVELSPEGEMKVVGQPGTGEEPQAEMDAKDEENDLQKSSELAPVVKDSDEPGVDKSAQVQEGEAKFLEGMADKMPRPAPMEQDSLNARAKRGMLDKLSTLKKV